MRREKGARTHLPGIGPAGAAHNGFLTRASRAVRRTTLVVLAVAGLSGCRSDGRLLFAPPGSVAKQRTNAVVYDPYTDNDIGPEVVGGRPKDYQKPLSETERSRLLQRNKALF